MWELDQATGDWVLSLDADEWIEPALAGGAPFLTVWIWIFGDGIAHGEPGLFFRSMEGWHRATSSLSGVAAWLQSMKVRFVDMEWKREPGFVLDYGLTLTFAIVAVYQLAKKRWADAAWTGAAIALPSGHPAASAPIPET